MTHLSCAVVGLTQAMSEIKECGLGWLGSAALALCSFAVGALAGALYKSSVNHQEVGKDRRRALNGLILNHDMRANATIPIPNGWSQHNPKTAEGRRAIADLIINHDASGKAKEMLQAMFDATTDYSKNSPFMAELQMPLADYTDQDIALTHLWANIVPAVWSALPKFPLP